MLSYQINAAAEFDLQVAVDFYAAHAGKRLAALFLAEFERVMNLLCEFPDIGTPLSQGRRTFPMRRFPYSVFYSQHDDKLRVIAVVHHRRSPAAKPH